MRPYLDAPEDAPRGLGGTAVNQLVRELVRRGRKVLVVTCDRSVEPGSEVILEGEGLRVCYGPYRLRHRARDAFRVERRYVAATLRREAPDVVHAHWTYEFALGALASRRPTLITCRDWAPAVLRYMPDPYRGVRLSMQMATLLRGRHFTAVSPYIRRRIAPFVRAPVSVLPNGLEAAHFRLVDRVLNHPATLVSVNVGIGRLKNVGVLLQAFQMFRTRHPRARLVLIGDGYDAGGQVDVNARQQGLATGVEFRGKVPHNEVLQSLAAADVLVHPSREESFGNVLIEAMAQGVPVVGGQRSGAVPWVLDHGRAGVLTDVTSPRALTQALEWLLGDAARWRQYGVAGYRRAAAAFRVEHTADQYERCYRDVCKAKGR